MKPVLACIYLWLAAELSLPPSSLATAPNEVMMTIDTLRADRVCCSGYKPVRTPMVEHLARALLLER